jgi:GNAT superfamily N-acetyltransferase
VSAPDHRYARFRVARPAHDLDRSTAFYEGLLGLRRTGGFDDHDGFDGAFFALPGGGELELTTGPAELNGATDEDLLVLYVRDVDTLRERAAELEGDGVRAVESPNPYWNRWGRTFLDPDGYRVVIAAESEVTGPIEIEWYAGAREQLRPLFELAEDSASQLDEYVDLGRVLVARQGSRPVGHLQLVPTAHPGEVELKNMAVEPRLQGTGVGRALVEKAIRDSRADRWQVMTVATAAADVGNLRFYQRVGFRMLSVERDAFTPATGYPDPIHIDGIPLRDRVWLSQQLQPVARGT